MHRFPTSIFIMLFKHRNYKAKFCSPTVYVYVVVNFLSQVIFIFPLFLGMVIYANKFKTKEKQKLPEIKN